MDTEQLQATTIGEVFVVGDVRRMASMSCAGPGCYTVAFYSVAADVAGDDDRARAVGALIGHGWDHRAGDLLCPAHCDPRPVGC